MAREREQYSFGETERAERERTLTEKIYRLHRDLSDPGLNARQQRLLRAELQAALSSLEALTRARQQAT